MISDPSLEAVQDSGPSTHVTLSSANTASNELDTVFNLSQLEGMDAGQQVCLCGSLDHHGSLHS